MKTFKEYFLESIKIWFYAIWVFPQEFLGGIIVGITGAISTRVELDGKTYEFFIAKRNNKTWSGVSLGDFIIFADENYADKFFIKHEYGHHRQSLYLGWLYLIVIGIPSFVGNIRDRVFHQDWSIWKREKWYYSQPWEKWADKLGGVDRGF